MIGKPLIILPYGRPGCLNRLTSFLTVWIIRVLLIGMGFMLGYACKAMEH